MGLRELDESAPGAADAASPPSTSARPARLRQLLGLAVAVAALVAFAGLARQEGSSSARLRIGASEGTDGPSEVSEDRTEGGGRGGDFGAGPLAGAEVLLRPLDPATLADVPANLLSMGVNDWSFPSDDGALLALLGISAGDIGEVDVVDARTFQPVASVELEGAPIGGLLGFTPEADALVVQRGNSRRGQTLTRYPLDPSEDSATVELPERLDVNSYQAAVLADGRVALLGFERVGGEPPTWAAHVLVADLLAERLVFDLPLPGLRFDHEVVRDGPLYFPGVAWDTAGDRLYLAHADSHHVTVVDLAAGTVAAEADLRSAAPGVDGLVADGTRAKTARLSPDGSRLFVTGQDYLRDGPGEPLGLSVVDTATLTEVGYVRTVAAWVEPSPDGRWLAWTAQTSDFDPPGAVASLRVGLLDTETLEQVAVLGEGYRSSSLLGFSLDAEHIYVSSEDPEGGSVVRAHALPSLEQTGERRLPAEAWFDPGIGYLRQPAEGALAK